MDVNSLKNVFHSLSYFWRIIIWRQKQLLLNDKRQNIETVNILLFISYVNTNRFGFLAGRSVKNLTNLTLFWRNIVNEVAHKNVIRALEMWVRSVGSRRSSGAMVDLEKGRGELCLPSTPLCRWKPVCWELDNGFKKLCAELVQSVG